MDRYRTIDTHPYLEDDKDFDQLVEKHLPLVFGTAQRMVSDHALAEEIAQNVFIAFAQRSNSLPEGNPVAGWLYRTTINQAKQRLRSESRRLRREHTAAESQQTEGDGASVWTPLLPDLEEAMLKLSEKDRVSILLRFFEGQSFRRIGNSLGIGEDAARKRVGKALSKLTEQFRRRGYTIDPLTQSSPLLIAATPGPPTSLASTIASVVANTTFTETGSLTAGLITMTKLKATVATTLVATCLATPYLAQRNTMHTLEESNRELRREIATLIGEQVTPQVNEPSQQVFGTTIDELIETEGLGSTAPNLTSNASPHSLLPSPESTNPTAITDRYQPTEYIQISRSHLQSIEFPTLGMDFELAPEAKELLEFTPAECLQLEQLLTELKSQIQAHDVASMKTTRPDDVEDSDIQQFLTGKNGEKSVFRLRPYDQKARADLQSWISEQAHQVLGDERATLLLKNARRTLDYWLGGHQDKLIAFVDYPEGAGATGTHEFMVKLNTPSMSGTFSGTLNEAVPPMLEYLFEATGVKAATP